LLGELVRQLNDGRIYDRDLAQIDAALIQLIDAHHRRTVAARRERNLDRRTTGGRTTMLGS
jgi:hypothetical protein